MGDRANVCVREEPGGSAIWFYTHWSGTSLPQTVAAALKRGRSRWDDAPYLNRIIFSEMIKDSLLDETGYGISDRCGDGDNRIVVVYHPNQVVWMASYPSVALGAPPAVCPDVRAGCRAVGAKA